MPKFKYALERGGEKSLEISCGSSWKNIEVRFNGNLMGKIPNRKELKRGRIFQLPDGTTLRVQSIPTLSSELRLLRNDKPVPGSGSDPGFRLSQVSDIIYAFAGLNILLGFIALIFQVEYLQTLSYGIFSIAIGCIFLVLGFFTKRRSLFALIIAVIILSLNILLVLFSGFITALERFRVPDTVVLRMIGGIIQYMSFPFGLFAGGIVCLIVMGQSVAAINELKKEDAFVCLN